MDSEFAPAKLNLALHVRARRSDGYHKLETLFAFVDIGDVVHARASDRLSLAVTGPSANDLDTQHNLVLDAARMLAAEVGRAPDFALTLDKRLPVASGIGGGSADAAATLRLLARAWGIDDEAPLLACATRLGADVPACVRSHAAIGRGRGEVLAPRDLGTLAGAPVILANPGVAVSTADVFARWDGVDRGPLPQGDPRTILDQGRNDLQAAAVAIAPQIAALLAAMASAGAQVARMSGSGATCFSLHTTEAERDAALADLRARWPGYWIEPAALR